MGYFVVILGYFVVVGVLLLVSERRRDGKMGVEARWGVMGLWAGERGGS